jgi:hypothetical protein
MTTAEIFLPPRVQARLYDVLGYCPHRLPADAAAHITALWAIRNAAAETELDNIDDKMEAVVRRETTHLLGGSLA